MTMGGPPQTEKMHGVVDQELRRVEVASRKRPKIRPDRNTKIFCPVS